MTEPRDPFDQTLADTAEVLEQAAEDTLAAPCVQEGLADPERDEAW